MVNVRRLACVPLLAAPPPSSLLLLAAIGDGGAAEEAGGGGVRAHDFQRTKTPQHEIKKGDVENPFLPFSSSDVDQSPSSLEDAAKTLRDLPKRRKEAAASSSEAADVGPKNLRREHDRNLQTANATAGDVQIAYISGTPARAWVSVPVPYKDAQAMSDTMSFQGAPAVKGTVVGVHTVFYDILLDLPANAYLVGDLEPHTSSTSPQAPTSFVLSPWIDDDLARLVPQYSVVSDGQALDCSAAPILERQVDTVAHQQYKIVTRCGGIVLEFFAHVFHDQEVVEWELFAIFSDYSTPDVDIAVDSLSVTFGEFLVMEDFVPLDISKQGTYNATDDTWTVELVKDTRIGHGQGTPVFKGYLLCLNNTLPFFDQIREESTTTSPRWPTLLSRLDGRIYAGRTNWDDRWLAFQAAIPRYPGDDAKLDAVFNSQFAMMSGPQDLYASRQLGLNKNAGSTGMQPDFGSQKGTQATHGDLRFVSTWHYHLQESMRPFHYREQDGTKTTGSTQSNWVTWSQVTHYHPSVSPNQLGKPNWWSGGEFHGWTGKDDQHKSSNALNAAIATLDWPAYRSILRDEINVALENVRFLPGQDPGAPRAIGRRMLADANAYLLTGDEHVWDRLVLWHATNARSKSLVGPPPLHMTVAEAHDGDKPPFLCVEAVVCVQGQHAPLPKIIVWQAGLLMKGLVGAWNVHLYRQSLGLATLPGTDDLEQYIVDLATTAVRYFYVQRNDGQWQTWNYIAWNGGSPVDESVLNATNTGTAGLTYDRVTVGNVWWDWHFGGYYYLARANHGLSLPADVVARLDSMATNTETDAFPGSNFERREWYAFTA